MPLAFAVVAGLLSAAAWPISRSCAFAAETASTDEANRLPRIARIFLPPFAVIVPVRPRRPPATRCRVRVARDGQSSLDAPCPGGRAGKTAFAGHKSKTDAGS